MLRPKPLKREFSVFAETSLNGSVDQSVSKSIYSLSQIRNCIIRWRHAAGDALCVAKISCRRMWERRIIRCTSSRVVLIVVNTCIKIPAGRGRKVCFEPIRRRWTAAERPVRRCSRCPSGSRTTLVAASTTAVVQSSWTPRSGHRSTSSTDRWRGDTARPSAASRRNWTGTATDRRGRRDGGDDGEIARPRRRERRPGGRLAAVLVRPTGCRCRRTASVDRRRRRRRRDAGGWQVLGLVERLPNEHAHTHTHEHTFTC